MRKSSGWEWHRSVYCSYRTGLDALEVRAVNEGEEVLPRRLEPVVESLQENGCARLAEEGMPEERLGLGRGVDRRLLDEDVLPLGQSPERPLIVQAIGKRDVDGMDGGIVEDG